MSRLRLSRCTILWGQVIAIALSLSTWDQRCLYAAPGNDLVSKPDNAPDTSQVCGRNALFMLLREYSIDSTLEDVVQVTPVGHAGTTLKELRDSARRLGLPCDMIQTDIETLIRNAPSPCIVLTRSGGLIPDDDGNAIPGHYLIFNGLSEDGQFLELIDGTFGLPLKFTRSHFHEVWSGIALVPHESPISRIGLAMTFSHLFAWICFITLDHFQRRKPSIRQRRQHQHVDSVC